MDPRLASRTARSLDALHALSYFAPEVEAEVTALGVRRGMGAYFASRSAAMGRVGAGTVAATFFVFNPSQVAHFIPAAWQAASPEDVVAARYRGVSAAWERLLGRPTLVSPQVGAAADLAREAAAGCTVSGRPLYAAHADLAWPQEPHLVLFHALTLLREHRGDGHVAALVGAGLSGIEALVTHTATGKGFTRTAARTTRGWSEAEWAGAEAALADRGLMSGDGVLTDDGRGLRRAVEIATDQNAMAPWEVLGDSGTSRLADLGAPLVQSVREHGAFPAGVFA